MKTVSLEILVILQSRNYNELPVQRVFHYFSAVYAWNAWDHDPPLARKRYSGFPTEARVITRVIFTSGQNLKPLFLCQYLIFFNDFFFILEISFGSLLKPQNRNLKKIADMKVYCNLKEQLYHNQVAVATNDQTLEK